MVCGVGPCILVAALAAVFAAELGPLLNVAARDRDLVTPAIRIFVWALPLWAFVEIATSALRARMVFGAEIRLRIMWEQVMRRSEEHTSELQSLMRSSYAVFCLDRNKHHGGRQHGLRRDQHHRLRWMT